MAPKVTAANAWAGATLAAHRKRANLTQNRLAELAGIERSAYIALEKGRRKITLTYAERIAPHIKVAKPEELLPRQAAAEPQSPEENPVDRLAALVDEVARLREEQLTFAEEVVARLAALEATPASAAPPSTAQEKPGE